MIAPDYDDLIAPSEIAVMFDVKRQTVSMWLSRARNPRPQAVPFPPAVINRGGRLLYSRQAIHQWGIDTDRLPVPSPKQREVS